MKTAAAIVSTLLVTSVAFAGDTQVWTFDEETTGDDIVWMSPTAVRPDAALYDTTTELTGVWVTILVFGFPVDVNVTDQIPAEDQVADACLPGPPPLELLNLPVVFPAPPEPPALAATMSFSLDANGFGHLSATDVVFGEFDFGDGTVPIVGLRIAGTITLDPLGSADCRTDFDNDETTGVLDLLALLGQWGACGCCVEDVDEDGIVGVLDLLTLLAEWDGCEGAGV